MGNMVLMARLLRLLSFGLWHCVIAGEGFEIIMGLNCL